MVFVIANPSFWGGDKEPKGPAPVSEAESEPGSEPELPLEGITFRHKREKADLLMARVEA